MFHWWLVHQCSNQPSRYNWPYHRLLQRTVQSYKDLQDQPMVDPVSQHVRPWDDKVTPFPLREPFPPAVSFWWWSGIISQDMPWENLAYVSFKKNTWTRKGMRIRPRPFKKSDPLHTLIEFPIGPTNVCVCVCVCVYVARLHFASL